MKKGFLEEKTLSEYEILEKNNFQIFSVVFLEENLNKTPTNVIDVSTRTKFYGRGHNETRFPDYIVIWQIIRKEFSIS